MSRVTRLMKRPRRKKRVSASVLAKMRLLSRLLFGRGTLFLSGVPLDEGGVLAEITYDFGPGHRPIPTEIVRWEAKP
jgi:hypothetical protein